MPSPERSARRWSLAVAALTIAALALRGYHYGLRAPWLDEVETRLYADGGWLLPFRRALAGPPLSNPPLYFALVKLARTLGVAGAHLRLPSVLCGAAAIPLLFMVGRRLVSARVGFLAAALLAISPLHVRYSQEARCYTLLIVEELLFVLAAQAVVRATDRRTRLALVASAAALGWTHYAGLAMALGGLAVVALLRRQREVWLAVAAAALTLVPVGILIRIGSGGMHAEAHPITLERVRSYAGFFGYQLEAPFQLGVWLIPLLAAIGLSAVVARRSTALLLPIVTAAVPILLFAAIPSPYVLFVRYLLHALPIVLLLAALGIDAVSARAFGGSRPDGQVAAFMLCALLAAPPLRHFYRERGTPFEALGALLAREAHPDEPIWFVHLGGDSQPIEFYAPEIRALLSPYLARPVEVKRLSEPPPDNAWRIAWGAPDFRPRAGDNAVVLPAHDHLRRSEIDVLGQGSHFSLIVELPGSRRADLPVITSKTVELSARYHDD